MLVLSLVWGVKKLSKHTLMVESLQSESGEVAIRAGPNKAGDTFPFCGNMVQCTAFS